MHFCIGGRGRGGGGVLRKTNHTSDRPPFSILEPGRVNVTSFCSIQNWPKGDTPETDLVSFKRSAKCISSKYPLHYL